MIDELAKLPEISFIDDISLEALQAELVKVYEQAYKELTGIGIQLDKADPQRLCINAYATILMQQFLLVDRNGKQDLLKYAYGSYLDNLAANLGVSRLEASPAHALFRFTLSAPQTSAISIPKGTRITNGNKIYFATDEYDEIRPGELSVVIPATCTQPGMAGTGLPPGSVKTLVDLLPFMDSVQNIEVTTGGADIEDDEGLRERVFYAPAAFSTAGPKDAYIEHIKSYSSSIGSVQVTSPRPCEVLIYLLLKDGSLPSAALIEGLKSYLEDKRPLTDLVSVYAPKVEPYDIELTYWIASSSASRTLSVQTAVEEAVREFNMWQTSSIGRDINPSELTRRVVEAGAKRVEIARPVFTRLSDDTVARIGDVSVIYGGLEHD